MTEPAKPTEPTAPNPMTATSEAILAWVEFLQDAVKQQRAKEDVARAATRKTEDDRLNAECKAWRAAARIAQAKQPVTADK